MTLNYKNKKNLNFDLPATLDKKNPQLLAYAETTYGETCQEYLMNT